MVFVFFTMHFIEYLEIRLHISNRYLIVSDLADKLLIILTYISILLTYILVTLQADFWSNGPV